MSQGTQTGLCIKPRGWDEKGDGKEVQEGRDIWTPMDDSC